MVDVVGGVVAGVASVSIVALVGWGWRKARVRRQRGSPLSWKVVHPLPRVWDLVLDSDLPRGQIPELADASPMAAYEWMKRRGGVDWRETRFRLHVRCSGPRPVVIRDIRAEITDVLPPIDETKVSSPSAGAEAATVLVFDLDTDEGVALTGKLDGALTIYPESPWFDANRVSLPVDDEHEFIIFGCVSTRRVRWRLRLDADVDGHVHTIVVDEQGSPFETSGFPKRRFAQELHWAWYDGGGFKPPPVID